MKKENIKIENIKSVSKSNLTNLFFEIAGNDKKIDSLIFFLNEIKSKYKICPECFYIQENNACFFCNDDNRDKKIICVVSSLFDAYKIFNTDYKGLIHVITYDKKIDFNNNEAIEKLSERLYNVNELVIALNLTFEGEVLSNLIKNKFEGKVEKISRIAQGIPFGGSLNYADYETLSYAILNRKKIK